MTVLTLAGGISNRDPNSSKLMLLYNLLAESRLCSITARSNIVEPNERKVSEDKINLS